MKIHGVDWMKIVSIEPTPSPNTMKITLNEALPAGSRNNYKKENAEHAPRFIQDLLQIEGIKGVYHVADFLAVERMAKFDWKTILPKVREVFGEDVEEDSTAKNGRGDTYGDVKVFVQMFQGIPMQVKLTNGEEEKRFALPDRFMNTILEVQKEAKNVVMDREWKEQGIRYGELDGIGADVVDEICAAYPDERLKRLKNRLLKKEEHVPVQRETYEVTLEMLEHQDWRKRYAHLEQMKPTIRDLPVLKKALQDEKMSIRRLAVVYLGMIEEKSVLPLLIQALKDPSMAVRRTAGDTISDIGDKEAIPAMMEALKDPSKLVRWRAAMFLYEVGDESALDALKEAEHDPEFEVSMQIKMAIERIEGGEEAKGSVWKQMTERRINKQ